MRAWAKRPVAVEYPETDDMGEHELQRFIAELLRPLVERWLAANERTAHAGADQFFYYVQGDPRFVRAPDVYVIEGIPQNIPEVGSWKVWEGHVPHFALEICGSDWEKDYDAAHTEYARMGTRELVIFDPGATPRSRRRVRWQVYRRNARGAFRKVTATMRDRVRSDVLGCFLRVVDDRGHLRLRLATGDLGEVIVPTETEAALAETEAAKAATEAAKAATEAALAEVARLRAELARRL